MTVWFTGCTHFGHKNILHLAKRDRFKDVQEMDEHLISVWNERVKPEETVYHLGDVTWGNPRKLLPKLNGRIVLIVGNHDDQGGMHPSLYMLPHVHYLEDWMLGPTGMVLCHYPFEDWNGRFRGSIHLHAHTHSKELARPLLPHIAFDSDMLNNEWVERTSGILCNRFHVGVDSTPDYAPISLDEIVSRARGEIV